MKEYDTSKQEPLPEGEKIDLNSTKKNENDDEGDYLWDGSESEFIEDDEAEVFEESCPGIKLSYELKIDEIFTCLKKFSYKKSKNKKIIVETVLLAIVCVLFLLDGILKRDINGYIFSVVSAVLIGVIWVVPDLIVKSHARELTKTSKMYVEVYPDEIIVGSDGIEKKIALDGKSKFANVENLFVIMPPNDNILIIPLRAIEPDFLADVEAMIVSGTSPIEDD